MFRKQRDIYGQYTAQEHLGLVWEGLTRRQTTTFTGKVFRVSANEFNFRSVQSYRDTYGIPSTGQAPFIKSDFYDVFGSGFKTGCIGSERDPKVNIRQYLYFVSVLASFNPLVFEGANDFRSTLVRTRISYQHFRSVPWHRRLEQAARFRLARDVPIECECERT